ncbi:exodeoxyribonuclease V, beta subunit domain protein [Burkholderia mallei]|nr:exodeoxyribonuclease V, beta subunit domain protein [Burkholderia mallei]
MPSCSASPCSRRQSAAASSPNQSDASAERRRRRSPGASMAASTRSSCSASIVANTDAWASSTLPIPHAASTRFTRLPCRCVCTSTAMPDAASGSPPSVTARSRAPRISRAISAAHACAACRCASRLVSTSSPAGSVHMRKSPAPASGSVASTSGARTREPARTGS